LKTLRAKTIAPEGGIFAPCEQLLLFTVPIIITIIGIVKPYFEKYFRDFERSNHYGIYGTVGSPFERTQAYMERSFYPVPYWTELEEVLAG
jgi:hypothetical protein